MKAWKTVVAAAGLAYGASAQALDFGVMETATPIEPRHFKVQGYPLLMRTGSPADTRANEEDEGGFAVGLGYGFPHGVDLESVVARYDGGTIFGSDVEWQPWRSQFLAFSFGGGAHFVDLERGGSAQGLDSTAILTYLATPRLDLNAAVDVSVEDVDADVDNSGPGASAEVDNRYETAYFAPGLQYRFTRNFEAIAEVGFGLNDEATDYASAGLSWYFR